MTARRIARRLQDSLPLPLWLRWKRSRGYVMTPRLPLELSRLSEIASLGDDALRDVEQLSRALVAAGLSDDDPSFFPAEMRPGLGVGLRHWQYPIQFAPYLIHVGDLGPRSYLEVGVQHGGTFLLTTTYLARRTNRPLRARAVDLQTPPAIVEFGRRHPDVSFRAMNSNNLRFRSWVRRNGPFDLALIDGDHSYEGCMADFEAVQHHATSIAFHDICNTRDWEVHRVWSDLRARLGQEWTFTEFAAQYPGVPDELGFAPLGIGVMTKRL